MKNLNKLMEHYKQTVRIDANNAWDIICHFKEAVCENTNVSEESLFEIMKDFHEKLIGKHFTEPYALYQVIKVLRLMLLYLVLKLLKRFMIGEYVR